MLSLPTRLSPVSGRDRPARSLQPRPRRRSGGDHAGGAGRGSPTAPRHRGE